jgi:hypothetical protein
MKKIIKYKSRDGYFDIIEKFCKVEQQVEVTHLFLTLIDGIENFETVCIYNMSGQLIEYSNSYGTVINYRNEPITVLTKPNIFLS